MLRPLSWDDEIANVQSRKRSKSEEVRKTESYARGKRYVHFLALETQP